MRSRAVLALSLALALAPCLATAQGPAGGRRLVDRTVAFVARQPVLLSDVRLEMDLKDVDEARATDNVIDEFIMFDEASRAQPYAPRREDVAAAVADLRAKVDPAWTDAALRRVALRQLVILAYVAQRVQPLVRVDEGAVRLAWEERTRGETSPVPFEDAAPAIRVALERAALDVRIEEWVRTARERAEVRRIPRP